jgi:error-prone DNA polymerase
VQDARRHGIQVRPVDVRFSDWDGTLEDLPPAPVRSSAGSPRQPAVRLGLRQVAGFREDVAARIVMARGQRTFDDVEDLCARAGLDARHQALLADAGALKGLAGHRHRARWAVEGVEKQLPLFGEQVVRDEPVTLPVPRVADEVLADYASIGLTLGPHPLSLLRRQLTAQRCRRSRDLAPLAHGTPVRRAGLVTLRQRPETASGATFVTLEDEDGLVNVVVWRDLAERQRRVLLEARLLLVEGRLESAEGVQHLIAGRLQDLSPLLGSLATRSRDFR